MCIIVAKPKNIKVDERFIGVMEKCFLNNPDGFGYMYPVGNRVHIKKGYMKWNNAEKELRSLLGKDMLLVLHFRVATHGKIDRFTCHPFPLTNKVSELKSVRTTASVGVAHNGVVSFCASKKSGLSDTQVFIKDYLSKMDPDMLRQNYMQDIIAEATNSKFAIMFPDAVHLIGNFIEDDGIYYSNITYKTGRKTQTYTYGYNWYYGKAGSGSAKKDHPSQSCCALCGIYDPAHRVMDYIDGEEMLLCDHCYSEFYFTCPICKEVLPVEYMSETEDICFHCSTGWEVIKKGEEKQ